MASTLGHIASRATAPQSEALVSRWLREAAVLIETSAPHELLALQTRHISERLLRSAGLT
ncbi:MAG: hypothetical protein JXA21_01510 [Anaerolineae bacterium]|nr:hypothetical protein [Anaerolineae bacterium]